VILTFRPLKLWPEGWRDPGREAKRADSPFRATYSDTLELLDRELRMIDARDPIVQVAASERDVRLDGQLRADAKVEHPGVILTVDTKRLGTLTYACDRYRRPGYRRDAGPAWQHNLRAIALGLEALRTVERYGIAERGQQYAGYRELPSGIAAGPAAMTLEDAARLLVEHGEWGMGEADPRSLVDNPGLAADYYRHAAKAAHPDTGGDPELFRRLTEARDLLLENGARQ
jgi:hypothetical protein